METPADKSKPKRKRQRKQAADKTVKRRKTEEGEDSKHRAVGRASVKRKYTKKKKQGKPAAGRETTYKPRNLNKEERIKVQTNINREEVILYVYKAVPECLVPDLFPQRLILWEAIQGTIELKKILLTAIEKFLLLLEGNSKGKDKYANLYISWLDYICTFTCRQKQTLASLASLSLLKVNEQISFDTQKTVIAAILHAVQDGIQKQIANKIEHLSTEGDSAVASVELPADDTALYRLSGWALKCCVENCEKDYEKKKMPHTQEQLKLLLALKLPNEQKTSLPRGVQYLDRGGLTFIHSSLLSWLQKVEASIKVYLNQDGFAKYGENIFEVTKKTVLKDATLELQFTKAVKELHAPCHEKTVQEVHVMLLTKYYNARSNEFLRNITKLTCIKRNKGVDVNVGLRDKLKCYAADKHTSDK